MRAQVAKKFYFFLASLIFFNADNRVVDYIHRQSSSSTSSLASDPGPAILLGFMGLVVISGAFGLLRYYGFPYPWRLTLFIGLGVVTSLVLNVQGRLNIWFIIVLYFAPQLSLLFVTDQKARHASHGVEG
jgi:hypothetical protein